jgi:hypothetical protein
VTEKPRAMALKSVDAILIHRGARDKPALLLLLKITFHGKLHSKYCFKFYGKSVNK